MSLKKIKANIKKESETRFEYELTPWGSLISSLLIVSGRKWSNAKYNQKVGRATFPYLDDEDFVGKTLRAVGLSIEDFVDHTIGVYRGKGTVMFAPVSPVEMELKDGSKVKKIFPLPISNLNKDFFPNTIVENIENVELMTL